MKKSAKALLRELLFQNSKGFATRPKDYDIIIDEKGVEQALNAILGELEEGLLGKKTSIIEFSEPIPREVEAVPVKAIKDYFRRE